MKIKPFIYGLNPSLENYALETTFNLYKKIGYNTGNLVFHHAIRSHIQDIFTSFPWGDENPINFEKDVIGIIPCANQLSEDQKLEWFYNIIKNFQTPLIAIGLGAQSNLNFDIPKLDQGTINWVKSIFDHSITKNPNVSLRGEFTRQVMEHYGLGDKTVVLGCPSLFINPNPHLGQIISQRIKEPQKIAVISGHPAWIENAQIENYLAQLVSMTGGSYIGQSGYEMMQLTRGEAEQIKATMLEECRNYIFPNMTMDNFIHWSKKYGNLFFDIIAWMEYLKKFDFVIGMRIHGIILALQSGIPALCIVHDSRTLELCRTMMIPYVLAKDLSVKLNKCELIKLLKFDPENFDQNRSKLCKNYINFLKNNFLSVSHWLEEIKIDK